MKNILVRTIVIALFLCLMTCNSNTQKSSNQLTNLSVEDSIKRAVALKKQDSLVKAEEKIALGNINFGISKKEYTIEEKKFLNATDGKLGSFKFTMVPVYYNEGIDLRRVMLVGEENSYELFKCCLLNTFKELKDILNKRYGSPVDTYIYENLPNVKWEIGNKTVHLSVSEQPINTFKILVVFKYKTKEEEQNLLQEGINRKRKSIEKAVDDL